MYIEVGVRPPTPEILLKTPDDFLTVLREVYSDIKFHGEGGMAWVYEAVRCRDGRRVAVKVAKYWDREMSRRFMEEVIIWQGLEHPGIVKVFDYAAYPRGYLEMEFLPRSLEDLPKPLDPRRAAHLLFQIADALRYAHSRPRPVLHLDIKPGNIRLYEDGRPGLADWGMAKVLRFSRWSEGKAKGYTPIYAAPEQIREEAVDERTDIWQLGVVFYELVAGKTPFEAQTEAALNYKILEEEPPPLSPEAGIVERIILRCLEKKKEGRYPSIRELQKELASLLHLEFEPLMKMSQDRMEKVKLCTDLAEHFALEDRARECALYLKTLKGYVRARGLKSLIEEEVGALEFYAREGVGIRERLPSIREVLHRARMGE